ncbi:hypothetical protein [Candidatus Pristimantibacillus sp. PTI5]|uniref:hypothetical protein n=1 Tax=Candidatus Pristimantibacillus sp. PTI5 TaxID=3400422 RepID=UPI003B0199E6
MKSMILILSAAAMLTGCRTESSTAQIANPSHVPSMHVVSPPADLDGEKVIVYHLEDNSEQPGETISNALKLTDTDLINVFKLAFRDAQPINGIVKGLPPSYKVVINKDEYDLWIGEGKTAIIAHAGDSHTLYRLSASATFKLKEIVTWSEAQKPVQGLVMDKEIIGDSLRVLVAINWTGRTHNNLTMDDIFKDSNKANELAWYTVDQEFYVQACIGQHVSIIAAAEQLESKPPIRFSITARLLEPRLDKSSFYLKLVEEELIRQQLLLKPIRHENEWVLTGVTPSRYTVGPMKNENKPASLEQLSVYIFESEKQLEAGLEDFHKQTALMDLVYPRIYKINNVMLFYWARSDMDKQAILGPFFAKAAGQLLLK